MESLLKKVNELYGLNVVSFEKVTKGCLSENHVLIGDKNKFFLKKYRFDNKDKIKEIHAAKKYFFDGRIPVIMPIVNSEKNAFFIFDNAYYSLFPFINDKQLERGELTNTAIISLGETLGKIHLLGRDATLIIKEPFRVWDKEKSLEKIESIEAVINEKNNLTSFDFLAVKILGLKRKLISENSLKYEDIGLSADHLIHGDYLDHNVFFDMSDQVSHVFDFEKANYSPRMYELFRSLMYIFPNNEFNDNLDKAKLYLNSYLNVYPATRSELQKGLKLYYLKNIHSVWIESEHFLKNNSRVDQFLGLDLQRIEYQSNFFSELEKYLLTDVLI